MSHLPEQLEPTVNLFPRERNQSLSSETFYGKASHHPAVIHGSLQHFRRHQALRSDVAKKTAGKSVARARRIVHFFQRERRRPEGMSAHTERMISKENSCPILSVLDHPRPRPFVEDPARSPQQVVLAGK